MKWSLFIKLQWPSPKVTLCKVWLKLVQYFWIIQFRQCIFVISLWSPLGNECSPSIIWTNLNPLHRRRFCAIFFLLLARWLWNRRSFVKVFSLFRYYLPFEIGMALYLNKHDFLHPRMLCAKFDLNWPCGCGIKEYWISSVYCYFVIISPRKQMWSFIWTPFTQGCFVPKFGWNRHRGSREQEENVYRQTDGRKDDG